MAAAAPLRSGETVCVPASRSHPDETGVLAGLSVLVLLPEAYKDDPADFFFRGEDLEGGQLSCLSEALARLARVATHVYTEEIGSAKAFMTSIAARAHEVDAMIVCGHGTTDKIRFGGEEASEDPILRIEHLRERILDRGSKRLRQIVLLSCSTGKTGKTSIAQQLAISTGVPVLAPVEDVYDGEYGVNPFFPIERTSFPLEMKDSATFHPERGMYSRCRAELYFLDPGNIALAQPYLSEARDDFILQGVERLLTIRDVVSAEELERHILDEEYVYKLGVLYMKYGYEDCAERILSTLDTVRSYEVLIQKKVAKGAFDELVALFETTHVEAIHCAIGNALIQHGEYDEFWRLFPRFSQAIKWKSFMCILEHVKLPIARSMMQTHLSPEERVQLLSYLSERGYCLSSSIRLMHADMPEEERADLLRAFLSKRACRLADIRCLLYRIRDESRRCDIARTCINFFLDDIALHIIKRLRTSELALDLIARLAVRGVDSTLRRTTRHAFPGDIRFQEQVISIFLEYGLPDMVREYVRSLDDEHYAMFAVRRARETGQRGAIPTLCAAVSPDQRIQLFQEGVIRRELALGRSPSLRKRLVVAIAAARRVMR